MQEALTGWEYYAIDSDKRIFYEGYHFFSGDGSKGIRTKDIDCMFSPHAKAVASAIQVTEQLLQANWSQRKGTEWSNPGGPDVPADKLPMVRLQPPTASEWFIELLGAPDTYQPDAPMKQYHAVKTSAGYFSICSFGFLALAEWDLDQALTICIIGLLASMEVGRAAFAATGRRVIAEVIESLEKVAAQ